MTDDTKTLLGLLNGLARHEFYDDKEITEDFLREQLFPEHSTDEFNQILQKTRGILKSIATSAMDLTQLEAFLSSKVKKKEGGLTENQAKVYTKFWKTHKEKIHESLVSQSTWNNTLKSLSWRIDVKANAKNLDQINTPTAILDMQIENKHESNKGPENLRFEMDESSLGKVLENLKDIERQIEVHCQ